VPTVNPAGSKPKKGKINMKRQNLIHILMAIVCFALSPQTRAVDSPHTPDPGSVAPTNTADGESALAGATGFYNSAVGFLALLSNGAANYNTGVGAGVLLSNTAANNTAVGAAGLFSNITGTNNTAIGTFALFTNTEGINNTASGWLALFNNTTGSANTANGVSALTSNTEGTGNTAVGISALAANITGEFNTAIGDSAGLAVITATNVIAIGRNVAGADVSNTTWIGNVFGVTTQSGTTAPVIVSDTGQLGTLVSSERFKKDIATMDKASEAILSLRPVRFHYKTDATGTPQFGLIAEEVAKVNPALVLPDKEGKPYTVRYEAVNAMLLNEFLKEHRTVEELKKELAELTATVKEQASQIQKVSAQLEASKPAPRVVNNP
jgi:hypothetical protein